MIERYSNKEIKRIWSDENKHSLWQKVEFAVIEARGSLGRIAETIPERIKRILGNIPINIAWCKEREKIIHHDLNAFVDERREHLPKELASEFHKDTTSYDDEEPATAVMLESSTQSVKEALGALLEAIKEKALKYRFTPMLARTHGQWAQIQSFGYECLTWHEDLGAALADVSNASSRLRFTKLSGAIGNNAEIDPELEREALMLLGRQPHHGATQIMPRIIYAQLASGLAHLVTQCEKIALDIRLGARSGYKILEESFDVNQEGSSAMPQKRNTILTEQICGMGRAARHFAGMLGENIVTWESRAIEQSCVERIAWPDLFHVTMRVLLVLTKVIKGLNIYPDQMMREIAASAGTYASNAVKTFLAKHGADVGISANDAYRIVRLASHIAFEPNNVELSLRENPPVSWGEADSGLQILEKQYRENSTAPESIEYIIAEGRLHARPDIGVDADTATEWCHKLQSLFINKVAKGEWRELFRPSRGMRNEANSFQQVFKLKL